MTIIEQSVVIEEYARKIIEQGGTVICGNDEVEVVKLEQYRDLYYAYDAYGNQYQLGNVYGSDIFVLYKPRKIINNYKPDASINIYTYSKFLK